MYRKLNRLCDILDEKSQVSYDPNPHGLRICESNEFLLGLKKLYGDSDANEQVRLMTIAPKEWGRQKNRKMVRILSSRRSISSRSYKKNLLNFFSRIRFASKPNQARRSLFLRKHDGILAYPQCLRGSNRPLSDSAVDAVINFYREDGISRTSSNSKDTIKTNGQPVAVRFLMLFVHVK